MSSQRGLHMTGLGATVYFGLFAIAALWLYATSDRFNRSAVQSDDRAHRPERSNSWSAEVDSEGSNPWLMSHPSSK